MNQALVQDVVAEVMKRLGNRAGGANGHSAHRRTGPRAGEDAPANEPQRRATYAHPHSTDVPTGQFGIYAKVDDAVAAATEAQKKLVRLSLDDRDAIVKLIKSIAKQNAETWGKIEIEKLKILELVPGVEYLKTNANSGSNGVCLEEFAPFGVIGIITPVTHSVPTLTANV